MGGGGGGLSTAALAVPEAAALAPADFRLLSLKLVNDRDAFGFLDVLGESGERVDCGDSGWVCGCAVVEVEGEEGAC